MENGQIRPTQSAEKIAEQQENELRRVRREKLEELQKVEELMEVMQADFETRLFPERCY